jgi:hypothetical protein
MSRARTLSKLFNTDGNLNLSPVESINGNAPFGRKNIIINGDQRIAQRGTDINGLSVDASYIADRFLTRNYGGAGTYNYDQVTDTVPDGFQYSSKLTVATAASDVGTRGYSIEQRIEGYNVSQLRLGKSDARSFTISFWARSSVAGTYSTGVRTTSAEYHYVSEFTLVADTWKYISYTVPALTSSLSNIDRTNGTGLIVDLIGLASQTAKETSTLNTWTSGNKVFSSNQTDWMGTSGNTLHFTGVQLEIGDQATDFEYTDINDELLRCKRYFQPYTQYVEQSNGTTGSFGNTPVAFVPAMRAAPSFTATTSNGSSSSLNSMTVRGSAADGYFAYSFNYSTTTSGYFYLSRRGTADAEL